MFGYFATDIHMGSRALIHQAFSRTVFVFFNRFCEFECNTTSDWLNHYGLANKKLC